MGTYLITGRQGTGKSSVIRELQRRGYTAYNTDEMPEVTRLQDRATGEFIEWPKQKDWDAIRWNWQETELRALLESDETVFIGAVTSNQADFYPLFDKMFALIVQPDVLATYLANHEHNYTQPDIDRVLKNLPKQQKYMDASAIPITNDRQINETVDEIISLINEH